MMLLRPLLCLCLLLCAAPAGADQASDARIRALEAKIQKLERRIEALESRPDRSRNKRQPGPTRSVALPVGKSPVLGPANAPIKVTIFSDLQCPYCARVHPLLIELVQDAELRGKIAVVWKHLPLSFHKEARPAAYAAMAAREQSETAFWAMVEGLYDNQRGLTFRYFEELARRHGLNPSVFEKNYREKQSAYDALIAEDIKLSRQAGVRGTPTIFVNGYLLKDRNVDGVKTLVRTYNLAKGR